MQTPTHDLDLITGERSRRSLKKFVDTFFNVVEPPSQKYYSSWVIDAYCDHWEALHKRQIKNLLVNVPPNSTKTLLFQIMAFGWTWIHEPSAKFLYAMYSEKLSMPIAAKCRALVTSELYRKCYPHVVLSDDQNQKALFVNTAGGQRQTTSVQGPSTGLKGNYLIVDDAHNVVEKEHENKIENTVNWYFDSFFNRLNNFEEDVRVVIGQRIHRRDLSGFILENMPNDWVHLCIPYEYRKTSVTNPIGWKDPRSTEGEPLKWDGRFSEKSIKPYRADPVNFAAQFNQNPIDSEFAAFKLDNWKTFATRADGSYILGEKVWSRKECVRVIFCDIAASTSHRADYSVFLVVDITPHGDIIIVYLWRDKLPAPRLVAALSGVAKEFSPGYIVMETGGVGSPIIAAAISEGLPVKSFVPGGSKEERSLNFQIKYDNGQVYFPADKPWLNVIKDELANFPGGQHDDIVDALSMAAIEVAKRKLRPFNPIQQQEKSEEALYMERLLEGI